MELGKYKVFRAVQCAAFINYSPDSAKTCMFGFVYQEKFNLKTKE